MRTIDIEPVQLNFTTTKQLFLFLLQGLQIHPEEFDWELDDSVDIVIRVNSTSIDFFWLSQEEATEVAFADVSGFFYESSGYFEIQTSCYDWCNFAPRIKFIVEEKLLFGASYRLNVKVSNYENPQNLPNLVPGYVDL